MRREDEKEAITMKKLPMVLTMSSVLIGFPLTGLMTWVGCECIAAAKELHDARIDATEARVR